MALERSGKAVTSTRILKESVARPRQNCHQQALKARSRLRRPSPQLPEEEEDAQAAQLGAALLHMLPHLQPSSCTEEKEGKEVPTALPILWERNPQSSTELLLDPEGHFREAAGTVEVRQPEGGIFISL